jgi:tetratricopeptide (TPR) repeat protein
LRAVGVFLLLLLRTVPALGAGEDAAAIATVQSVLNDEYAIANFGEAKKKLEEALAKCGKCSGATKAQLHVALAMVCSQTGKKDEAKGHFDRALAANPDAALPARGVTPDIKTEWGEAKKKADQAKAPPPEETPPDAPAAPPAGGQKIPGWNSPEAFQEASAALQADLAGKIEECIKHDKRSLELEEQPRTRLHLSSCEARAGKLLDALRNAQKALEVGIQKRDAGVMKVARDKVTKILPRIPHVTFVPPPGVEDLNVSFDDRPVPAEALRKKFSIDPGKHTVHAEGVQGGVPLTFEREYTVQEGELLTVVISMKAGSPEFLTPGQLRCMVSAKTQEEVLKCLPQNKKNLAIKAGFAIGSYTDTNYVDVTSPEVNASISSPTAGWNVGGNFLVDVYSAASPDIVAMASRRFHEKRYAGGLTGGYKPGKYGVQAFGNVSSEPDYLSLTAGGALTAELRDKLIVPRLSYAYSNDTIGRGGTPFDVYSKTLTTQEIEGGVTFILSPTALLLISGTLKFERGDQSKPYRYIPMFDRDNIAPFVPNGATVDLVNRVRLPVKPLEQLPTERDRYAIGARYVKRIGSSATLRIEERLYYDSWQSPATTTDLRYVMDLSRAFRVWPHVRVHFQKAANFYQLAYSSVKDDNGTIILPTYRTTDRELGTSLMFTLGGGTRIAITPPEAHTQLGLTIMGDLMYTRYFNALYITQRTALYGSIGLDAEFD